MTASSFFDLFFRYIGAVFDLIMNNQIILGYVIFIGVITIWMRMIRV